MNVPVGAAGVRGLGGRGYLAYTGLGRGYQVKADKRDAKLYDLLPGMELTPMNPVSLKPQGIKLAPQVGSTTPEVVKLAPDPLFKWLALMLTSATVLCQSA